MVLRTIGPRITGPWDLGCLGSKVRGPKVRGSKALGLIILEPVKGPREVDFVEETGEGRDGVQGEGGGGGGAKEED